MLLKNALVYDDSFRVRPLDIVTEGERIAALLPQGTAEDGVDLKGYTVIPGMIDIHIHGYGGADSCDADPASIATMSRRLAEHGVTSFCPTSMTLPFERLEAIFRSVDESRHCVDGARPIGINMEGPYISPARIGGQNPAYVRKPDAQEFERLQECCHRMIRLVDIAPEEDSGFAFTRAVSSGCTVSVAHTDATYEQACAAFDARCRHITHLYNAMTGLNQRNPGVVGAAFDKAQSAGLHAELICDGKHIHPAALRVAFSQLGEDHTVIISDALSAAGTADGEMVSGGLPVWVRDGVAYLENGTIAGSTTNLEDELRNVISFGIPVRQAIKSLTVNPARAVGLADDIGSVAVGKRADLTVLDADYRVVMTIVGGQIIYCRT